jgi:hypothetical protein
MANLPANNRGVRRQVHHLLVNLHLMASSGTHEDLPHRTDHPCHTINAVRLVVRHHLVVLVARLLSRHSSSNNISSINPPLVQEVVASTRRFLQQWSSKFFWLLSIVFFLCVFFSLCLFSSSYIVYLEVLRVLCRNDRN